MGIESNAAIDVQGQRKIVIYNRSKYNIKVVLHRAEDLPHHIHLFFENLLVNH